MKDALIAKVAAQCEDLYADASKQLALVSQGKPALMDWTDIFVMKQHAYHGIAEYYQGLVAKSNKEFGEQICRLTKAVELLKQAESKVQITFAEKFKEFLNKAQQELDEVRRDNDFIYHARIPDHKTLPQVSKAALAKPSDLPPRFFNDEVDLFSDLLPFGVHQSVQKLEMTRKTLVDGKLIAVSNSHFKFPIFSKGEINTLRELTQTLNASLASLNLPASIEDLSGKQTEVPKSLKEKSSQIKQKGGIEELDKLLRELPDLLKRNKEILDEIQRSIDAEEESDNGLKAKFGARWTRTASSKLNAGWRSQIAKYKDILNNAIAADDKIKVGFEVFICSNKLTIRFSVKIYCQHWQDSFAFKSKRW